MKNVHKLRERQKLLPGEGRVFWDKIQEIVNKEKWYLKPRDTVLIAEILEHKYSFMDENILDDMEKSKFWTLTLQRKLSNTRRFKARAEPAVEEKLSKLNALKEARANGVGPSSKRRRNDSNDPSVSIVYCLLMNLFCLVYVFSIIWSQVNYFVISG